MKTDNKKRYTSLLFALCAVLCLASCNESDDLGEIFKNHTWKLSFFREGTTNRAVKSGYNVTFYDGSFTATTPAGAVIAGNWIADSKNRTFHCTNVRVNEGNITGDTTAMKMRTLFEKATSYQGDANYLQIREKSNEYMQFHNR